MRAAGRPSPPPRDSSARRPRRWAGSARRGRRRSAARARRGRSPPRRGCGRSAPRASAASCPGPDGGACAAARARARRARPPPAAWPRGAGARAAARSPPRARARPRAADQRSSDPRRALLGRERAPAGVRRPVAAEARRAAARRPRPPLAPASFGLRRAAARSAGVGSNVTQPMPRYQTSTHEWASRSRTTYSRVLVSSEPEVKPVDDARGHAAHPQQQRHRARELLAVAALGVEQEALEVVRRARRRLAVVEAAPQVRSARPGRSPPASRRAARSCCASA